MQAAGKGVQVSCCIHELDHIKDTLDPQGLYLAVGDVPSREAAEAMLNELTLWCVGK